MNRSERALEMIRQRSVKTSAPILDIGCGFGELLSLLSKNGYSNLTGLDASEDAIMRAKREVPQARFICKNLDSSGLEPSSFDVACLMDVYEHVINEQETLRMIHSLLKSGGHLILSVPHAGKTSFLDPANVHRKFDSSIPLHRHYSINQLIDHLSPDFKIIHFEKRGLGLSQLVWMVSFPLRKFGLTHLSEQIVKKVGEWDYQYERGSWSYHLLIAAKKI